MSTLNFDPIDLALLGAGWSSASVPLTVEDCSFLHEVAIMLAIVYTELAGVDGYPGVFGYEISEPLGKTLAQENKPDLRLAEQLVRIWMAEEMGR
ncbi:MAG: hypothetical protein DI584_07245 [Stenotrophomonas sp.]|nr:MAG: hypothetical protein DI584_07245 [Stenotrophomonas sp.]